MYQHFIGFLLLAMTAYKAYGTIIHEYFGEQASRSSKNADVPRPAQ